LDTDLREAGFSSLDMVNLVLSVEEEFSVTIPEAQITPGNLRSVAAIGALIDKLAT
jgi:acyl carrier protein